MCMHKLFCMVLIAFATGCTECALTELVSCRLHGVSAHQIQWFTLIVNTDRCRDLLRFFVNPTFPTSSAVLTVLHTGLTTSVEGGVSSFELCPGIRLVTTRVTSIGKSFEIDDAHLLTALGTHCQCQLWPWLWRQYYQHGFTLLV